jgi:ABC-type polysaccharide/polyol phosphate transport system ATPase subunit
MPNTLEFQSISKRYYLGGSGGSLRQAIPNLARRLAGRDGLAPRPEIWALRDVTFQIGAGEAVAIVGPNGAGKTTALKLATFVTQPTRGQVLVRGRTSALIELGAGFHPELTGRENIYLNGTILGLKRQEIAERFDAIVAFSELERFLDTPVKRYSSGMYARLGFSVAAHVNPDLLIVDEVLAVGDLAFQAKCLAHMAQMVRGGTTVVIVSHQLPRVRRLCSRGIFLQGGQVLVDGPIDEAIVAYQAAQEGRGWQEEAKKQAEVPASALRADSPVAITGVTFLDGEERPLVACRPGDRLVVRIGYHATRPLADAIFEVWVHAADGTEFAAYTTEWDGYRCPPLGGQGHLDLVFDPLTLAPGGYSLGVAITAPDGITRYDWHIQRYHFQVQAGNFVQGLVYLPHQWKA